MADLDPLVNQSPPARTSFPGDVLKLVSGTTLAQALNLLAAPFLTRLFEPEAFGVFALFSAITGIIASVFTLKYELAIMLPERDSDAVNLLAGSLGIATLVSLLMAPIIWLGGPMIARWLNAPSLAAYLWLVPLALFFGGVGAGHPALNAWASRTRHFAQVSTTRVAGTLTAIVGKLAAGFAGFKSEGGLIAGTLVGSIVSPLLLGWQILRQYPPLSLESIHWVDIWKNLKRYRKFAIYNTPSALLNAVSWQVPSFLLSVFFSPTVVGYYAFGNQLLRVPMDLIGASIAQAFFSHATTAYRDGKLAEIVEATFRRLVEYSFFPIFMLAVIGKQLVVVVFGFNWAEDGVYIQILSLWMIFWFISSPLSHLYSVLEKNELSFRLNIIILVTRVVSVWIGGLLGSPRLALIFFSVSGVLIYGYLNITIVFLSGVSWRRIGRILVDNIVLFMPAGVIVLLLRATSAPDWIQVLAATVLVGAYLVYRLKNETYFRQVWAKAGRTFTNPGH